MAEKVISAFSLAFLLADIALTLTCCAIHFMRGSLHSGMAHGAFTLAIFCVAGIIANFFHFMRHELPRMPRRSGGKRALSIMLIFLPNYYLLMWSVKRLMRSDSLTVKCWTASLRLFYCSTGSLVQAVFQSYLVIRLWWEEGVPDKDYSIMIVSAVYLCVYAIYGVCRYVWVQYYDETGGYLPAKHIILITIALTLNMSGRVVAMSVVMGTLGWLWLLVAVISPFFVNFAVYSHAAFQNRPDSLGCCGSTFHCFSLVPFSLLSAMTVSDKRILTILTTLAWMASFLPQILTFHTEMVNWLVWLIPTAAQIIALLIMMVQWEAFESAFQRFSRLALVNVIHYTPVSNKAQTERREPS